MEIQKIKCPCCGANLDVSPNDRKVTCPFCGQTSILKKEDNLQTSSNFGGGNEDLIESANNLLELKEYLSAKKKFKEYTTKYPENYEGWLGLLRCKTRDFTIKDNNAVFESELNKYVENFEKTAPKDVFEETNKVLKYYLNPNLRAEEERQRQLSEAQKEKDRIKRERAERYAQKYPNGKPKRKFDFAIFWTIFMGLGALAFLFGEGGPEVLVSIFFTLSAIMPLRTIREKMNVKAWIVWVLAIVFMFIGMAFMK